MESSLRKLLLLVVVATVVGLAACGSSGDTSTTHISTVTPKLPQHPEQPAPKPKPKPKPQPKPKPPPPPSPKEAALDKTTKCLQGIPLLKVDTSGGTLADIEVSADVDTGGGNALIAVFSSHDQAAKYASAGGSGTVGNLAAAIYTYKGSQNFQASVEGCLA